MLDWIFEGIVTWVSSVLTSLMDAVSGLFFNALGTDMTGMEEYFPFVTKAFSILQYTAWAILFLITVWQLFRSFGGPITEAENPLTLLARSAVYAILIGYAKPIFEMMLDVARAPYTALMDISMSAEDFTFAGVEEALKNGLVTFIATTSVLGLLLLVILEIALGWNYFKLLLETVERYIVVGVLCYTSPLAFSMGGSKETNSVFKSWCRMVGSQLLLLVMNVWFLRAFDSAVGQFIGTGGTLSNGKGSIFLWLFCALAFLKCAQKFDSYLSSMGLSVAQTGASMGMEMLMATRVITGFGGGLRTAGGVFRSIGGTAAGGAAQTASPAASFASGFANRFKGNSYVRDAVVSGGTRMGVGGSIGFVGRAFGGIAARNGASLTGDSISSVASRPSAISGSIGGEIADRSLQNYMPQFSGKTLSDTQISGGHISTKAIDSNGKETAVELFNASQFEKPDAPHALVTASDGSQWYQMASGPSAGSFYDVPHFSGTSAEAPQVAASFPDAPDGTVLRSVDKGAIEATSPDGVSTMWYNSAYYDEPDAPHSVMQAANGVDWYSMQPHAEMPSFEPVGQPGSSPDLQSGGGIDLGAMPQHGEALSSDTGGIPGYPSASQSDFGVVSDGAPPQIETPPVAHDGAFDGQVPVSFNGGTVENIGGIPSQAPSFYQGDAVNPHTDSPYSGDVDIRGVHTPSDGSDFYQGGAGLPQTVMPSERGAEPCGTQPPSEMPAYGHVDYGAAPSSTPGYAGTELYISSPQQGGAPVFEHGEQARAYNQAQFQSFMPGYEQTVTSVDTSQRQEGRFEVRHGDGSGTMFYDTTRYAAPRGDYQVYEDSRGSQWYAIPGQPAVERRPVYEGGKAVYDGENVKTVSVETVRYKTTPNKYSAPAPRQRTEIKTPKTKK